MEYGGQAPHSDLANINCDPVDRRAVSNERLVSEVENKRRRAALQIKLRGC